MQLKLNSWHVWLWNYTYPDTVPNNLCPYFWKTIAAMLLFIPNIIFRIPVVILSLFFSKNAKFEQNDGRTGIGILIYIILAAAIFVIIFLYNYLLWLFNAHSYDSVFATLGGIELLIGLFFLIRYFWLENRIGNTIAHTASNNMVVNYTQAWYHKHCPRINWE